MFNLEDVKKNEKIVEETFNKLFVDKLQNFMIEKVIREEISPIEFGNEFYECLKKCLTGNNSHSSSLNIFLNNVGQDLLFKTLKQKSFEHFKEAIKAFERITQAEEVVCLTSILKSNLLFKIGTYSLKKDNIEKIEYICSSEILKSSNNHCDKLFYKVVDLNLIKYELSECLSKNILNAFIIMSKQSDNKNIVENYFPDLSKGYLSYNDDVFSYASISQLSKISIDKISYELLIRKFGVDFLKNSQSYLTSGKLKKSINKILSDNLSESDKIFLIITPLQVLNLKGFKNMNKLYPGIFEKINRESFDKALEENKQKIGTIFISNNEEVKKMAKKYNIDMRTVQRKLRITNEEVWKIIVTEKVILEKKQLKKQINMSKKTKTLKRL